MHLNYLYTDISLWLTAHPQTVWLAVFAIAMGESLAFVGLLLPGTLLMAATAAAAGNGTLPLYPVWLAAATGAICGDWLSFWLGQHYSEQIKQCRFFRQRQQLWQRGESFFNSYGSLSVFLARFIGPLRPIVPMIAGTMEIPPLYFITANITSAVIWSSAYLLPAKIAVDGCHYRTGIQIAALLGCQLFLLWTGVKLVRPHSRPSRQRRHNL